MKIGKIVETAIWMNGRETADRRARYEHHVMAHLDELCELAHVLRGPVHWTVLRPCDDRVPQVPDHIQGPDVCLLVAEAKIVAGTPRSTISSRSFIGDLAKADLERLREMTRRSYARHVAGRRLTDMECDDIIDSFGPEAAADAARKAVDGETVH